MLQAHFGWATPPTCTSASHSSRCGGTALSRRPVKGTPDSRATASQMLKALMPVAVFVVGCVFGTESFSTHALLNMVVVTAGVAVASYGEINLVWVGVFLQLLSVMTESTRLTLVSLLAPRVRPHGLLLASRAA